MVLEKEMLHVERLHSQLDLSKPIIKNLIYWYSIFPFGESRIVEGEIWGQSWKNIYLIRL